MVAIAGPNLPVLLLAHDALADLPVRRDDRRVDRRGNPDAAGLDDPPEVGHELVAAVAAVGQGGELCLIVVAHWLLLIRGSAPALIVCDCHPSRSPRRAPRAAAPQPPARPSAAHADR